MKKITTKEYGNLGLMHLSLYNCVAIDLIIDLVAVKIK
jgi:hypothetical protein